MRRCWIALLPLILWLCPQALAQERGAICVMAFDDRDGSGSLDAGEPPITGGIALNVLDGFDVTLATRLLEDAPAAGRGFVCVHDLPAGEYQVMLTSAQYQATTAARFAASVVPGDAPALLEFGAVPVQPASHSMETNEALTEEQTRSLHGIAVGLIGSLIVALALLLLGAFVYVAVLRRRRRRARQAPDLAPAVADPDAPEETA